MEQSSEDYVSIRLTKKVEINFFDLQDRLRAAFPNYLEIRPFEDKKIFSAENKNISAENLDPLELCKEFIVEDLSKDEEEILSKIINSVKEM